MSNVRHDTGQQQVIFQVDFVRTDTLSRFCRTDSFQVRQEVQFR